MGHKHCCYFLLLVLCCERASPLKCIEDTNAGRLARINALKREILHKLQISAPPNVTRVHPITSSVFAEYNATIAAQAQVNKALQHCAQHGRSAKEIFVYFPVPVQAESRVRRIVPNDTPSIEVIPILPSSAGGQMVTFDIDFRSRPTVSSAELRLFKTKNPDSNSTHSVRVIISHVLKIPAQYQNDPYEVKTYVTSKYISAETGYEVFNVTSALLEWISFHDLPYQKTGLAGHIFFQVSVGALSPNDTPSVKFEFETSTNDTITQLVISCYETTARMRRNKRDTTPAINSTQCLMSPPQTCCLRNLVVDFHRDLGFNWILQPTTYAINYCSGLCPWTVPQATESSLFLAYANERNPTASPQPCCAPDVFLPLTVVVQQYDPNNPSNPPTQQVQVIPDLVVQQCICR